MDEPDLQKFKANAFDTILQQILSLHENNGITAMIDFLGVGKSELQEAFGDPFDQVFSNGMNPIIETFGGLERKYVEAVLRPILEKTLSQELGITVKIEWE
jgi:hypothetical protein